MDQYPAEIGKILNTFLSTTSPNNWMKHELISGASYDMIL
jgi:hypothetical protein